MDRSPLYLAALASVAVPGLDPASAEGLASDPGSQYDIAFVQDSQHRRWVVRAPRTESADAAMDASARLLPLVARRLPFAVPAPKGFCRLKGGSTATVYPYIPGHPVGFERLPGGHLAAEIGRAIGTLHNLDLGLFEEAGVPSYDADSYRTRRLGDVDRAAATGRVPAALLARWERALEDVALWRFAPVPVHGDLSGDQVLVSFDDDGDAAAGNVRGLLGWEDAKIADPADDFAHLIAEAPAEALDSILEAYAHTRVERPDANLVTRARLASELALLGRLMGAIHAGEPVQIEHLSAQLRRLDERVHAEQEAADDYRLTSLAPAAPRSTVAPPPVLEDDEDDDPFADLDDADERTDAAAVAEPDDAIEDAAGGDDTEPAETDASEEATADHADGFGSDSDDQAIAEGAGDETDAAAVDQADDAADQAGTAQTAAEQPEVQGPEDRDAETETDGAVTRS